MWDWGTQPFSTIVVTFVFAVYLTSEAFGSENYTSQALAWATTIAGVLVAFLAPVMGQSSDRNNRTMRDLRWQTWFIAIAAGLMFFVKPHPQYLLLGLVLLGVGTVVNEIASVGNNAMLEEVAQGHNVGRISGFGWGMGYLGGIVSLLAFNYMFIEPEHGLFGASNIESLDIRITMVASAIWIALFTLPTFLNLQDRHMQRHLPAAENVWLQRKPAFLWRRLGPVVYAYQELGRSVVRLWSVSRQTVFFLIASALFRDGLNAIFSFGAVIAAGTFGFSAAEVIMFGAAANVAAGISTMLFGLLDDRIGPKKVIMTSLIALIVLATVVFVLHDGGKTVFWIAGMGLTLFVGPAQSASRSYLARLVPEGQAGEVFGLYATTGRAVSFISPFLFGVAISVGVAVTGSENTQYWGILGIIVVLIGGLLAMLPVREPDVSAMLKDSAQ
ncbi:MAG: MFS transporter [Propionibacteriaceae bacterium]|jgi:UMF1 family MFS transporter|nr:MFS transporter [Propionibacteriaceae bacterium]